MKTLKRAPVVSDAADEIRTAILDGKLLPGSRIAQDQLAAQLGVSRLPIRQALLVLEGEGLVLLDHNRGASVAPLDIKFISDVFDFRAVVDSQVAATLAARNNFDSSWLLSLVEEGLTCAKKGELRQDLSLRFHTGLYEAIGNSVLITLMEPLLSHVRRVIKLWASVTSPERHADPILRSHVLMWEEHAAIMDAIARHRVGLARALARVHVLRVKDVVVAYLVSTSHANERSGDKPEGRRRSQSVMQGKGRKKTLHRLQRVNASSLRESDV
jgi:DNA-binding GntR family transcriptional regulator